jgi:hypothetical protein
MKTITLRLAAAFSLALFLIGAADARQPRSHSAKATFQRLYHCQSTNKPRGPCPGHVIDHVIPLCAGGADDPLNMQWQTIADAKAKDRVELAECRALRGRKN